MSLAPSLPWEGRHLMACAKNVLMLGRFLGRSRHDNRMAIRSWLLSGAATDPFPLKQVR